MSAGGRPLRVVVCGTTFGQVYLEALREPDARFELAGVLARGSARSEACAAHYGVPLLTAPEELPDDVDAACVVVRSGLLGGEGAQLAQALLRRGVHVLQEHPLHHDELASCLRTARASGATYQVNSFYPHVAPVRRFLAAAHTLARREPILYVDAACGFQLAYSLLDVLGIALGGLRPWRLASVPAPAPPGADGRAAERPFRSVDGLVGGVPVTLRVQNEMDPSDPDNHAHVDHRVTLGFEGGSLTLLGTHGPLVLNQRPRYPHGPRDPGSAPHFGRAPTGADPAGARVLGAADAPGFAEAFHTLWPAGVRRALGELRAAIEAGDPTPRGQAHLTTCLLWQDLTARLGPPALIRRPPFRPFGAEVLDAVAGAQQAAA